MSLKVQELAIYPLKSAKGIKQASMQLGDRGPHLDRRWMLIDQNGKFITQRNHPKLCFIRRKHHWKISIKTSVTKLVWNAFVPTLFALHHAIGEPTYRSEGNAG